MLKVHLTEDEVEIARWFADRLGDFFTDRFLQRKGGRSNIDNSTRLEKIKEDQLTGQLGEMALSKLLTGDISNYVASRWEKDNTPVGDSGSDLIGYQVDVKTSRARFGLFYNYHLWVREREYHPDTDYYFAFISAISNSPVFFFGHIYGRDITKKAGDRYEAAIHELDPIPWENEI